MHLIHYLISVVRVTGNHEQGFGVFGGLKQILLFGGRSIGGAPVFSSSKDRTNSTLVLVSQRNVSRSIVGPLLFTDAHSGSQACTLHTRVL